MRSTNVLCAKQYFPCFQCFSKGFTYVALINFQWWGISYHKHSRAFLAKSGFSLFQLDTGNSLCRLTQTNNLRNEAIVYSKKLIVEILIVVRSYMSRQIKEVRSLKRNSKRRRIWRLTANLGLKVRSVQIYVHRIKSLLNVWCLNKYKIFNSLIYCHPLKQ